MVEVDGLCRYVKINTNKYITSWIKITSTKLKKKSLVFLQFNNIYDMINRSEMSW